MIPDDNSPHLHVIYSATSVICESADAHSYELYYTPKFCFFCIPRIERHLQSQESLKVPTTMAIKWILTLLTIVYVVYAVAAGTKYNMLMIDTCLTVIFLFKKRRRTPVVGIDRENRLSLTI